MMLLYHVIAIHFLWNKNCSYQCMLQHCPIQIQWCICLWNTLQGNYIHHNFLGTLKGKVMSQEVMIGLTFLNEAILG